VLLTGGTGVVVAASAPGTAEMLAGRGFEVETVDISEFEKAEAGLTCLSILVPATTG
jgi:dimethylargininase